MATITDLEREVKKLKQQVKRLDGRNDAAEVAPLGAPDAPVKEKGFSSRVADGEKASVANNGIEGSSCSR
jgi:hypothetical protein